MDNNLNNPLSDEVENQLDDLFSEDNNKKIKKKQKRKVDSVNEKGGMLDVKASNNGNISDGLSDDDKKKVQAEENEKILKALKDSADKLLQERVNSERQIDIKTENDSLIIKDLKEAVLSIDWEITDPAVDKFTQEAERLREMYQKDDTLAKFFRLLGSLGKHIKDKGGDAHPEAIKLLHSIYESLEKVFMSGDMTRDMKKNILSEKIERFKRLKEQLISTKAVSIGQTEQTEIKANLSKTTKEIGKTSTTMASVDNVKGNTDFREIADSLKELNKTIQNEFRALREELKLWREKK